MALSPSNTLELGLEDGSSRPSHPDLCLGAAAFSKCQLGAQVPLPWSHLATLTHTGMGRNEGGWHPQAEGTREAGFSETPRPTSEGPERPRRTWVQPVPPREEPSAEGRAPGQRGPAQPVQSLAARVCADRNTQEARLGTNNGSALTPQWPTPSSLGTPGGRSQVGVWRGPLQACLPGHSHGSQAVGPAPVSTNRGPVKKT